MASEEVETRIYRIVIPAYFVPSPTRLTHYLSRMSPQLRLSAHYSGCTPEKSVLDSPKFRQQLSCFELLDSATNRRRFAVPAKGSLSVIGR